MAEKKVVDWDILKRVLRLAMPYKRLFIITALLACFLAPVSIIRPMIINRMVDDYILKYDVSGLTFMSLLLIGFVLLEALMRYGFIYQSNLLGQSVIKELRVKVFGHLVSLKPAYFDRTPIGQSTTRTVNDIESINQVFSQGAITIIADLLGLIAVFSMMMWTSWKLTLVCLITFPFLVYGSYIFKEKVKVSFQTVRTQISNMNTFLNERISGMMVLQIFNAEKQELDKFKKINRTYTTANINAIFYYAIFFPFVEIVSAISIGLMVWFGAGQIMYGELSPGVLVVFPIYINMLYRPIRQIADRFNSLQMGMVAAERVFSVLDDQSMIENKGIKNPARLKGEVEFKNVDFSYVPGIKVLSDVSFKLEAGKTLAIVGSTGSGKSTIINLLNRFYEFNEGDILIDQTSIRDYNLQSLRSRIAIVLQDVFLFTGSVMDNIRMKNDEISDDAIYKAAEMIGADRYFQQLPNAYDYIITERGSNLSMGQRQLISFVRALVFEPDILILDEATSSIDSETEATIQYAIEKLVAKRSSIIIAHRLSTIRHADRVLVLNKGKVAEEGSTRELLEIENGVFKNLHDKQLEQQNVMLGR